MMPIITTSDLDLIGPREAFGIMLTPAIGPISAAA